MSFANWREIKNYLLKAIYRFNSIPIQIPVAYYTDLGQIFQKYI